MRRSAVGSGMAVNILTRHAAPRPTAADADVELVELRVLDGPNRFFTRPAMKLEFAGGEPGARPRWPRRPGGPSGAFTTRSGCPSRA